MYEDGQTGTPGPIPPAAQASEAAAGYEAVGAGAPSGTYNATGSAYPPPTGAYGVPPQYPPPQGTLPATAAGEGLSDTAAGAIAYITILPAILFLVLAPYNQRPFVKFHAFQCLGLGVAWICLSIVFAIFGVIPILGHLVWLLGSFGMFVVWVLCIIKASQGTALKLPVISKFASEQSGYWP